MATLACAAGGAILFAAQLGRPEHALIGALLGYLIAQVVHLRWRADWLEKELERSAVPETPALPIEPAGPAAAPGPSPPPRRYESGPLPQTPVAPAKPAPSAASATPIPQEPRVAPPPRSGPSYVDQAIAWFKRGNPLARVGIVVLFFGGAFLAKYSADRGLFPLEVRLVGLAMGTLALLLLGWRLRARRAVFAQTLQGGGIAGFYLTVFAAARLYHLMPYTLALALLIVAAIASAVLAVAQNALALAVIGFSGGFMAPILLSTGSGNHVALFTYYTILNLGIFCVAWFRAWRVLNLVGLVFTFGIFSAFRASAYTADKLVSTDFFLILFFLMYVSVSILFSLRQKPDLKNYVSGSLVFGLPLATFGLHATLISRIEYGLAYSALAFGAFYLALAGIVYRTRRETLSLLSEAFAALGVIFASLAIPLAFDGRTTAAMWAVEGAGLLWIGVRQNRRLARAFGALLQLLGGCGYLMSLRELDITQPWLNSAYVGTLMLGVSGLLSGWWLFRNRPAQASYESGWDTTAAVWGVACLLLGGLAEVDRSLVIDVRYGVMLLYCAGLLIVLHLLALRLAWPFLDRVVVVLMPVIAAVGLLHLTRIGHPVAQSGYLGWPALLVVWYLLLKRFDGSQDKVVAAWQSGLHAGGLWLVTLLLAMESAWQIRERTGGVWPALPWGLLPAAALWLAARSPRIWPFTVRGDAYRRIAAPPLAAACALWAAGASLTLDGDPTPLPYVPLLNPLDVSIGLALVAIADYALRLTPAQRDALWTYERRTFWIGAAALTFLWLNSALIRALHYLVRTSLTFTGILHSFLVQASLSVFWGLLGLAMVTASARRGQRAFWICGAALMGVVVCKLFLIDLAGSGTLARIVSFLTVGALLLLAGYFSPLPPAPAKESTS